MHWLWQAVVLFAITNLDDLVVLSLFFGRAATSGSAARVVAGQYLGFGAILVVSLAGAFGVGQFPDRVVGCLGIVPIAVGLFAAYRAWRVRGLPDDTAPRPISVWAVAGVTLANGGDNIGVYVPALAHFGAARLAGVAGVFLILVAVWCLLGHRLATHRLAAAALRRWRRVIYPAALIAVGLVVLANGGVLDL